MYQTLFGDLAFNAKDRNGSKDRNVAERSCEVLKIMADINNTDDARRVHSEIRKSLGAINIETACSVTPVHEEGNSLFKDGKFAEAEQKYLEASKLRPYNHRLYSNIALCQLKLEKYHEAASNAYLSTVMSKSWSKGHALFMSAYSKLGYSDLAAVYLKENRHLVSDDLVKEIDFSVKSPTKKEDLEAVFAKLLENSDLSVEETIDLLRHCSLHAPVWKKDLFNFNWKFVEIFSKCKHVSRVISENFDFLSCSLEDVRLIREVLNCLDAARRGCMAVFSNMILHSPQCKNFVAKLATYLATESGARGIVARPGIGLSILRLFSLILYCLVKEMDFIRPNYLQHLAPFHDFHWLVAFIVNSFCVHDSFVRPSDAPFPIMVISVFFEKDWYNQRNSLSFLHKLPPNDPKFDSIAHLSIITHFDFSTNFEPTESANGNGVHFWKIYFDFGVSFHELYERPEFWFYLAKKLEFYANLACENEALRKKNGIYHLIKVIDVMMYTYLGHKRGDKDVKEWRLTNIAQIFSESFVKIAKFPIESVTEKLHYATLRCIGWHALMSRDFAASFAQAEFLLPQIVPTIVDPREICSQKARYRNSICLLASVVQVEKPKVRAWLASDPKRLKELLLRVAFEGENTKNLDIMANANLVIYHLLTGNGDDCQKIAGKVVIDAIEDENDTTMSVFVFNNVLGIQKSDETEAVLVSSRLSTAPFLTMKYVILTGGMVLTALLRLDRARFRPIVLGYQRSHLPGIYQIFRQALESS